MPVLEAPSTSDSAASDAPEKTRRRLPKWLLPVAAMWLLAVVLGIVLRNRNDGEGDPQAGYAPTVTVAGVENGAPTQFEQADSNAGPAATTAAAAVATFLDAEMAGDVATSFAQLSAADRTEIGAVDDWQVRHAELPVYLSYDVIAAADDSVSVEATLEPQVNEVVGVIPASAQINFRLVAEDGGLRIFLEETEIVAHYPSDTLAPAAAAAWIDAARQCAPQTELEYEGSILGDLDVAQGLCGVTGSATAADAEPLDALADPTPVLNVFGSTATDWARVVTVTGLDGVAPLQIVLAPFGDHWVIVGAVAVS